VLSYRVRNKLAEPEIVEMMAKTHSLDEWSNLPSSVCIYNNFAFLFLHSSYNENHVSLQSPSPTASHLSVDKDIQKPQLKFRDKINNNVFLPKIKEKPHALEPLAVTLLTNKLGEKEFSHPYAYELGRFTPDPKFLICQSTVPIFKKTDEVPLMMVDNEESFKLLVKDLSAKTVLGVDLEVIPILYYCLTLVIKPTNYLNQRRHIPIGRFRALPA